MNTKTKTKTKAKAKNRKTLALHTETLRSLNSEDIDQVAGGAAAISWNGTCWSCKSCIACPQA